MEEGKQTAAAVDASSIGGTGTVQSRKLPGSGRQRAKLKLLGLIVGMLILLVAVGAIVYLSLRKDSNKNLNSSATTAAKNLPAYFSTLNLQEKVAYYMSQKDYTAAIAIYNNQLRTAKTADDRARANLGISGVYATEKNYQLEYQYALKAYANEATLETAISAGGAADDAGDKKSAIKYYQAAINLLPKENLPADQYAYQLRELQADMQEAAQ